MAERKTCSNPSCERKFTAKHNNKKYCTVECSRKAQHKRAKKRKLEKNASQMTVNRGEYYQDYIENYAADVQAKNIQKKDVAEFYDVTKAVVTKMHEAYLIDKDNLEKQKDWKTPEEAVKSLEKFEDFRDRYFQTETGDPYETADFHKKWISSILSAIDEGGEQMILSPPRHGKTDLLTHFAVWQICRNPNVRIMWVGGNEEIAKNAVGAVVDHLEHNEKLRGFLWTRTNI